jgi:hypothetical protein
MAEALQRVYRMEWAIDVRRVLDPAAAIVPFKGFDYSTTFNLCIQADLHAGPEVGVRVWF